MGEAMQTSSSGKFLKLVEWQKKQAFAAKLVAK
jgi:hypothetical protein